MISSQKLRLVFAALSTPPAVVLYLNIEKLAERHGWDGLLTSAWEQHMPALYDFLTQPMTIIFAVAVFAFTAGLWSDALLRRRENETLVGVPSALQRSSSGIQPDYVAPRDSFGDHDVIARDPPILAMASKGVDGIDLVVFVLIRNRSQHPLWIDMAGKTYLSVSGKVSDMEGGGIVRPFPIDSNLNLITGSIRFYSKISELEGECRISVLFGRSEESARIICHFDYVFRILSDPQENNRRV